MDYKINFKNFFCFFFGLQLRVNTVAVKTSLTLYCRLLDLDSKTKKGLLRPGSTRRSAIQPFTAWTFSTVCDQFWDQKRSGTFLTRDTGVCKANKAHRIIQNVNVILQTIDLGLLIMLNMLNVFDWLFHVCFWAF